jgi:hypothetical protein
MGDLGDFLDRVAAADPGGLGTGPLRIAGVHDVLLRGADHVIALRSALASLESRTVALLEPEAMAHDFAIDCFGPGWRWERSAGVMRASREADRAGGPDASIWFVGLPFRNLASPHPGYRKVLITATGRGFARDGSGPAELASFEPPAISTLVGPSQIPAFVRAQITTFRLAAEALASADGAAGRGWWVAALRNRTPLAASAPACEGAPFEPVERLILDRMGTVETVLAEWGRLEDQLLPAALAPERFAEAFARNGTLQGYAFDGGCTSGCAWTRAGVSVELIGATLPALVGRCATGVRVAVHAPGRTFSDSAVALLGELFRQAGREIAIDRPGFSVSWPVRPVPDERPLARLLALPDQVAIEGVLVEAVVENLEPDWPG